jgi:hypothetical protein
MSARVDRPVAGEVNLIGGAPVIAIGFFIGAGAMGLGGFAEMLFGVRAEQRSLEDIAKPLTIE